MMGAHCVRTWCATQKCVTLSSAEVELVALVRASTEALGLCQLASEWGIQLHAEILVDASAALGIVNRRGAGKLRHVRIGSLWVQESQRTGELVFRKVAGTENPADLMTKGLKVEPMRYLTQMLGIEFRAGSAAARLQLSTFLFGSGFPGSRPLPSLIRGGVFRDPSGLES